MDSDSINLESGLKFFISNKLPAEASVAGLCIYFEEQGNAGLLPISPASPLATSATLLWPHGAYSSSQKKSSPHLPLGLFMCTLPTALSYPPWLAPALYCSETIEVTSSRKPSLILQVQETDY